MSLGAALCIPPPPRIDDTMNMKKFVKLALGAIGVVYGDIAVSPIFVLKSIFYADTHALLDGETSFMELERFVNEERVMAILSFIFWVITVVCCFKYIVFVLKADKNGEGGTWALISLLSIENEESPLWKHRDFIFGLGCFAASFLLADSFVAPAICVLSAFEGVKQYSNGGLSVSGVEGLACFVLFVLLMSQRFGTSKVIKFYGPIMLAWFLTIFGVGLYNVSSYPKIFFALSPHHAVQFIVEHTADAYMIISQVVLAVAGVEAMYADLGHFKTIPIRVSFLALVYPALVISYLGQGAYLIQHPSAAAHPFFDSVPTPIKFYVLTLATLAAIIASQATISGCFTLIDQGIALKVFPTIQTIHTSTESAGAVYIPAFNYTLMCGSILLVVIFKESEILADIFGIGVTGTMISTTIFYIIAMKTIWKKPSWQVYLFATFFLLSDLILLAASLRKIISYGWVTTLLGLFFFSVMYIWHTTNFQINTVLQRDHLMEISELRMYVKAIHRTQGTIVFVANMDEDVPNVLGICAQRLRSLPENIVCLSAVASTAPFVADDERYVFRTVDAAAGIYRLVISYGYAERSINTVTAVERARKRGLRVKGDEHVTFVVGRDVVSSARDEKSVLKKMQLAFFARMVANTESLTEFYNLPPSDTLEIASQLII
ncbi:potassium transporter [Zopfochytrium polystomum]|nr:potassium transporter [Zopfochytrium polystomum]